METYATRPRAARNHGQAAVERGLGRVDGAPNSALNAMAGRSCCAAFQVGNGLCHRT